MKLLPTALAALLFLTVATWRLEDVATLTCFASLGLHGDATYSAFVTGLMDFQIWAADG